MFHFAFAFRWSRIPLSITSAESTELIESLVWTKRVLHQKKESEGLGYERQFASLQRFGFDTWLDHLPQTCVLWRNISALYLRQFTHPFINLCLFIISDDTSRVGNPPLRWIRWHCRLSICCLNRKKIDQDNAHRQIETIRPWHEIAPWLYGLIWKHVFNFQRCIEKYTIQLWFFTIRLFWQPKSTISWYKGGSALARFCLH